MGLYGVLVVTDAAAQRRPSLSRSDNRSGKPADPTIPTAKFSAYDADLPIVLSEIDPLQNTAVALAVATTGFSETAVWSGQPGACGDAAVHNCYPPAVNYSPRYYLVNGVSFDRTNLGASTFPVLAPGSIPGNGNVIVRFVNAGLRMHVPSIVNMPMSLIAEDGNPLPGQPRVQNEVFLAAGKTYDVVISPAQANKTYTPANYALFDRQLSLSTNNQRDGGMQSYIAVAGGSNTGVGSTATGGAGSATQLSGDRESNILLRRRKDAGDHRSDPGASEGHDRCERSGADCADVAEWRLIGGPIERHLYLHAARDGNLQCVVHVLRQR